MKLKSCQDIVKAYSNMAFFFAVGNIIAKKRNDGDSNVPSANVPGKCYSYIFRS